MQQFVLHRSIYKLSRISCTGELLDKSIEFKKKLLGDWEILKARKVPDAEIARITGISRATYYRRKKAIKLKGITALKPKSSRPINLRKSKIPAEIPKLIQQLRSENPTCGKAKITILLTRDHGVTISESSVGRIISKMLAEGKISRSISACKVKRKRNFKSHAKSWKYGMKAKIPGELIQIDHMSVTKNNIHMKHFQAWDPITKVIIADVVSNATSSAAAKFLNKVIAEMPFAVKSIQVDGGSEFMKDFENQCQKLKLELYVLPPRRPQWNGGVERGNRTFREEFYARNDLLAESIGAFRYELTQATKKYNSYRPHFSLNGLTPFEYNNTILAA